MSVLRAVVHLLASVDGATTLEDGVRIPNWGNLIDDDWLTRLSDGEQALVWCAFQLWNGIEVWPSFSLRSALVALDAVNRLRFVEAVCIALDIYIDNERLRIDLPTGSLASESVT